MTSILFSSHFPDEGTGPERSRHEAAGGVPNTNPSQSGPGQASTDRFNMSVLTLPSCFPRMDSTPILEMLHWQSHLGIREEGLAVGGKMVTCISGVMFTPNLFFSPFSLDVQELEGLLRDYPQKTSSFIHSFNKY